MIENFLHYIWLHKKFNPLKLKTTQKESLQVVSVGTHNHNSGPDFFNGRIRIAGQLWAGNIEIHIKSSDWFVHNHEQDPAYDNVILHVVHEHDTVIFRKDGTTIPTLELKDVINKQLLVNYHKLFSNQRKWINCEQDFAEVSEFVLSNWLERLYIERLERKSKTIADLLKASTYDWEAVLFKMLAKTFGLKVNSEAFFSMANSLDFSVVRKSRTKVATLEALFFGQTGLLDNEYDISYYQQLQEDYRFLRQKFQLDNQGVFPLQFFRLRPPNFPTIRLSQLANLYHGQTQLFSKIISARDLSEFYSIFKVETSLFWKQHYTFEKTSKPAPKTITKAFIDLLLINTILPLKFCHAKHQGQDTNEVIISIINAIDSEKNAIVKGFSQLTHTSKSALHSQGLIQLKTEYCDKHQCLKCAIGNSLLSK